MRNVLSYEYSNQPPTAEEFVQLRVSAGMNPRDVQGAKIGLANSNFVVTFRHEGKLIGMGRVIGDGATTFQITDVVVEPSHQRKGLGKRIMTELVLYLENNATPSSYVSLIADGPAAKLYEQFGFTYTAPNSVGMYQYFHR